MNNKELMNYGHLSQIDLLVMQESLPEYETFVCVYSNGEREKYALCDPEKTLEIIGEGARGIFVLDTPSPELVDLAISLGVKYIIKYRGNNTTPQIHKAIDSGIKVYNYDIAKRVIRIKRQ